MIASEPPGPPSDVLWDAWAWWEYIFATETGARLRDTYVQADGVRVHTSALALGELVAKLVETGQGEMVERCRRGILSNSEVHAVTPDIAEAAGRLRGELRQVHPQASLADAIMLATARDLECVLVSGDGAFDGLDDVVSR